MIVTAYLRQRHQEPEFWQLCREELARDREERRERKVFRREVERSEGCSEGGVGSWEMVDKKE